MSKMNKQTVTVASVITQAHEHSDKQKTCSTCVFHNLNTINKHECLYEKSCIEHAKNIIDADNDTCRHWASDLKYADSCANCKHCIEKTCQAYDFNVKTAAFKDWCCNNFIKHLSED